MRTKLGVLVAGFGLLVLALPALSHHSFGAPFRLAWMSAALT